MFSDAQKMFTDVIEELSRRQTQLASKLEQLEADLIAARSKIKEKDLEVTRLHEIIKTQEYELVKRTQKEPEEGKTLDIDDFENVMETLDQLSSKFEQFFAKIDVQPDYSIDISALNSKIDQLPTLSDQIELLSNNVSSLIEKDSEVGDEPVGPEIQDEELINVKKELEDLENTHTEILSKFNYEQTKSRALERQLSGRVPKEEYQQLESIKIELQNQANSLSNQLLALETEKNKIKDQLTSKQTEFDALKEQLTETSNEMEINQLKGQIDELTSTSRPLQDENQELIQKTQELNQKIQEFEKTQREAVRNLQETSAETYQLKKEKESLSETMLELQQKVESFDNEKANLSSQMQEKEEEIELLEADKLSLQATITEMKDALAQPTEIREKSDLDDDVDNLKLRIAELELEETNWQDEKEELKTRFTDLQKKITSSTPSQISSSEDVELEIKSLNKELEDLRTDLESADSELEEKDQQEIYLKEEIAKNELKVKELESLVNTYENQPGLEEPQSSEEFQRLQQELEKKNSEIEELNSRFSAQENKIEELTAVAKQDQLTQAKIESAYQRLKEQHQDAQIEIQQHNELKKTLEAQGDNQTDIIKLQDDNKQREGALRNIDRILTSLLPKMPDFSFQDDEKLDDHKMMEKELGNTIEKATLYTSLIDKFLKPHVRIVHLLKQGEWDLDSLAETVGLERHELQSVLEELNKERICGFSLETQKVWLISEDESE
jgi:chromosome segregation ATPase